MKKSRQEVSLINKSLNNNSNTGGRPDIYRNYPDPSGYFGLYGGRFVPETLMPAVLELEQAYREIKKNREFRQEFDYYLKNYVGRPTPLYHARRLGAHFGLSRLYLKREDLCHTGAHKINNALGQVLLARRMGKKRIIAETGAGQHGVATATAAALTGMECVVFMGAEDIERQAPNVYRMKLLGAEVRPVESGSRTLKEAINEALREWISSITTTHYVIGSVVGPHPFPKLVRDFQAVIGRELKKQARRQEGCLPDYILACVGGGSNAIGVFHPFIRHPEVQMVGVEAAGKGINTREHSATLSKGRPGVFHGTLSYLLQDEHGQVSPVHSVSAGLDYPGVGPEHSFLKTAGRARYVSVTDAEALKAFHLISEQEGILPALESSHALAFLPALAAELSESGKSDALVVVNLSGRGDKDLGIVFQEAGIVQEAR